MRMSRPRKWRRSSAASSEGGRWRSTASDWRGRRAGLEWPPSTVRASCSHLMLCARKPTNPHALQIPKITWTWRNWLQASTINSRSTPTQYSCVWSNTSISPEPSRYNVQRVSVYSLIQSGKQKHLFSLSQLQNVCSTTKIILLKKRPLTFVQSACVYIFRNLLTV